MSMLAEPRRKQKVINLRAKNSAWSNDAGKFGQRMLEKMGWSSGKGLGAKENGIVEHVVARYKNDEKGLGFEDKNDQWTKHEDDFNALLSNLSNDTSEQEKLHSGVSLEVKSKKSKARIHYHKFTRGKDIARYSEKDLANIFGKKTLKDDRPAKETLKDVIQTTEQVFTDKGSMDDYFKNKMLTLKYNKTTEQILSYIPSNSNENSRDDICAFKGFAQAGNTDNPENPTTDFKSFSFFNQAVNRDDTVDSGGINHVDENLKKNNKSTTVQNVEKSAKKSKKNRNKWKQDIDTDQGRTVELTDKSNDEVNIITDSIEHQESQEIISKKSKKKKNAQKHSTAPPPETEVSQKKKINQT